MSRESQAVVAERRLRKFLNRADIALRSPLFVEGEKLFEMQLVRIVDPKTNTLLSVELKQPEIDVSKLKAAIVDCRPFFLPKEDSYLPGVVSALSQLSDAEHARKLRGPGGIKEFVGRFIRDDRLVGGDFIRSGRLEMDNGAGTHGELLSSGQIAMDYIYGVALHEDDDRISRLENTSGVYTMLHATAMELTHLLKAVATVREQIRISATNGHLSIDIQVGEPSRWSVGTPEPESTGPQSRATPEPDESR